MCVMRYYFRLGLLILVFLLTVTPVFITHDVQAMSSYVRVGEIMKISVGAIEKFLLDMERKFWDYEYGGFFEALRGGNVASYAKPLASIVSMLSICLHMYNITHNESYLDGFMGLLAITDMFRCGETGTYYHFMNRDFSAPIIQKGFHEINGGHSIRSTINLANVLVDAFVILGNRSFLEQAEDIFWNIVDSFYDPNKHAIISLADTYDRCISYGINTMFGYLAYRLYRYTQNDKYLGYTMASIKILEREYEDGFYMTYDTDFSPINTNRWCAESGPLALFAYILAYNITGNTTYLDRIETLLNHTMAIYWDNRYGGYFVWTTPSFDIGGSEKRLIIQEVSGYYHYLSLPLAPPEYRDKIRKRLYGLLDIIIEKYNRSGGFIHKCTRDFAELDDSLYSREQFLAALLMILTGRIPSDNDPPILQEIKVLKNKMIMRIYDYATGIKSVDVSYRDGDTWKKLDVRYDKTRNIFTTNITSKPERLEIKIEATDYNNNKFSARLIVYTGGKGILEFLQEHQRQLLIVAIGITALILIRFILKIRAWETVELSG